MPRRTTKAIVKKILVDSKPKPDTRFRRHKSCGVRTNVGVCSFIFDCLTLNEIQPKTKKMTNAKIEELLLREFPTRTSLALGLKDPNKANSINLMRHKYNKGVLCTGLAPVHLSVRYNDKGQPVDSRTGRHLLTKRDYLALLDKYGLNFREHGAPDVFAKLPD